MRQDHGLEDRGGRPRRRGARPSVWEGRSSLYFPHLRFFNPVTAKSKRYPASTRRKAVNRPYLTITFPFICGCKAQKYSYTPGVPNVKLNFCSVSITFERKVLSLATTL